VGETDMTIAQLEHPLELRPIAVLPELGMVPVLFAPATIPRSDLKMTILMRADPNVGPGGWNHEGPESTHCIARANHLAIGTDVREATPVTMPADTRHRIGYVSQARRGGGPHVFVRN